MKLEDTTRFHVGTSNPTTGAATNADTLPVASVEEDGAVMGYSPLVENVATGLYRVTVVCSAANGFEAGKRYSVYLTATVASVTGRDGVAEFIVESAYTDDVVTAVGTRAAPGDAMILTGAYDPAKTAAQAGNAMTLTGAYDAAKTAAQAGDAMALTAGAVDAILDEVVVGSYTMRQLLKVMAAALAGKASGGGTTTITFRGIDDASNVIVATVDSNGNRSAVTVTV